MVLVDIAIVMGGRLRREKEKKCDEPILLAVIHCSWLKLAR
jgi:hypothetical protein